MTTNSPTPFFATGDPGLPRFELTALSPVLAGATATFNLFLPDKGQWIVSVHARTSTGKTASSVALVTFLQDASGPAQAAATVLHTAASSAITAISVSAPTASGVLPVLVTYAGGVTTGAVWANFRRLSGQESLAALSAGGAPALGGAVITAILARDTMTRADSTTTLGSAETGQAWAVLGTGVFGVVGQQAYPVSGSSVAAVIDTGIVSHGVSATLATIDGNSGLVLGAVDANNFYVVQEFGGQTRVQKKVAGSLSNVTSLTGTLAQGDRLSASIAAGKITIRINGASVGTITDTSITTGTKAGLWNANATTLPRWDDLVWTAADKTS